MRLLSEDHSMNNVKILGLGLFGMLKGYFQDHTCNVINNILNIFCQDFVGHPELQLQEILIVICFLVQLLEEGTLFHHRQSLDHMFLFPQLKFFLHLNIQTFNQVNCLKIFSFMNFLLLNQVLHEYIIFPSTLCWSRCIIVCSYILLR